MTGLPDEKSLGARRSMFVGPIHLMSRFALVWPWWHILIVIDIIRQVCTIKNSFSK